MSTKTLRRCVRKDYQAGAQIGYVTKSFTKDDGTQWHPTIDVQTGEHHCDCPQATFRKVVCKHVIRAAQNAVRNREAEPALLIRLGVKCCCKCGDTESLFGMVHADGSPIPDVHICLKCVRKMSQQPAPDDESPETRFARINAEIDFIEDDLRMMEAGGASESALERKRADHQLALQELAQTPIPSGNPATYEETRRYLQTVVNAGGEVSLDQMRIYQLVEKRL